MPNGAHCADGEADRAGRDLEAYKMLLTLWSNENPIKTTKLQVLLAVNALLVSAVQVSGGKFTADKWSIYAVGCAFNLVWTLSIGRTALFQEAWEIKLGELRARYPDDIRFSVLENKSQRSQAPCMLRAFGGVSSRWYLLLTPFVLAIGWLLILLFAK
jgi:hypothetical protein